MNQPHQMQPPQAVESRLPHNIEAEAALLGGMMMANATIDRVADLLRAEHFYEPLHGRIFSAITAAASQGRAANPVTLKTYFEADEAMKELGGVGYLAQLTGSGAAVLGVFDFAKQVYDLAQRRALIGKLQQALSDAHDTSEDLGTTGIVADLEVAIADAAQDGEDGAIELTAAQCIDQARIAMDSDEAGVTCGIAPVDEAIGPTYRSDMAVIAGRPGMGKTSLAISYAVGAARKGQGVLFVTLEMSALQLGQKIASDMCFDSSSCQVPYDHIVRGTANDAERRQLAKAQLDMEELPFRVLDLASPTVQQLARHVRRWKRRFPALYPGKTLDLVVVDYLQLLRAHGLSNRFEVVTEVSQSLKAIGKANGVGIMALSQLSRAVEQREDKRPHLGDLRESGQIEQDADVICFLYRHEYYLQDRRPHKDEEIVDWEVALEAVRGDIEFICAKRRKGRTGTTKGKFYGAHSAIRGAYA